jgi:hypothetical protein
MEWTSVKEKMPPLNENVLFFNVLGKVSYGYATAYYYCTEEEESTYFHDLLSGDQIWGTHWMPLPYSPLHKI